MGPLTNNYAPSAVFGVKQAQSVLRAELRARGIASGRRDFSLIITCRSAITAGYSTGS